MDVNGYISPLYTGRGANYVSKGGGSNLGMDDFLKLLAAQLANQDMMNPSQDTDFIAQMAQFSSLQSMDSMAKMTSFNQSTALVGKYVVVATYEKGLDKDGNLKLKTVEGFVEKVTLFGNEPSIIVNGKAYAYSNVMEIKTPPETSTVLNKAVATALENKTTATVSEDGSTVPTTSKWVTQEAMNAYTAAIELAQAIVNKADATNEEKVSAISALSLATETFNSAKKNGLKEPEVPETP